LDKPENSSSNRSSRKAMVAQIVPAPAIIAKKTFPVHRKLAPENEITQAPKVVAKSTGGVRGKLKKKVSQRMERKCEGMVKNPFGLYFRYFI
jgi:hypothetical protein